MNEKEIESCLTQVIEDCKALKIPVSERIDPNITVNKRAQSRFASCKRNKAYREEKFIIEVTTALLAAEEKVIKEILAHEVLHTCPGCYNHGPKWKSFADKVNRHYGYRIKTTSSYEELGLQKPEVKRSVKYIITCQKCGNQLFRQKKSKLVTHTNSYRCKCGGKLICKKAEL